MARLADELGTGTRKTLPTPRPVVDERSQMKAKSQTAAQIEAQKARTEATQAQAEAATALTEAKANAEKVAKQLGAKVDPKTGKIDVTTIPKTPVVQNVPSASNKTVVSTYTDSTTGDVIAVYSDGSTGVLSKGTKVADAARTKAEADATKRAKGESAFAVFRSFLDQFGIGGLAADVEKYKLEGLSDQELLMRLRTESAAYKQRFAANEQRVKKGLRALSEAEYIGLEDQYQDVMRRYGLPQTYYARGDMGRQEGFEKFIGGDVSPVELEDRIQTAQNRILFGPPQVTDALKKYFPEVTNGDILAYVLDPENSIGNIKRKVTISEIGGAAFQSALGMDVTRASELQRLGVTGEAYRQAAPTIRQAAERGSQLASFFKESPYTQQTAESMALNVGDAASAQEATRRLTERERGLYSGRTGAADGALSRERAGQF